MLIKRECQKEADSKFGLGLVAAFLFLLGFTQLRADTITIAGAINQSTQDGTGPAVNNPDLNNILDGDLYTFELSFIGPITVSGTYNLMGLSALFSVGAHGAMENSFNSASVTVEQSGDIDQITALVCLANGSGCNQGNELDLSFSIPSAQLNFENGTPKAIPGIQPLELLEDDGATDIHASVASYSYTPLSPVPEPSGAVTLALGFIAIFTRVGIQRYQNRSHR